MSYDPAKVIGDLELGLEVRTSMQSAPIRHIGILGLHHANMDPKDVLTTSLDVVNMATAGALAARPGAKTTFEPLLFSSTSAAPVPAERFNAMSDPATLRDGFKPTGTRYTLAARCDRTDGVRLPAGRTAGGQAGLGGRRARTS